MGACNILDLVRGPIINQLTGQVGELLQGAIDEQLCTTAGEFGCPDGTMPDGAGPEAVCRFGGAGSECVPQLLGVDGQGDLGAAFLGGFSPGTHAPGQFLLASGGDGVAEMGGLSLFMLGGYTSTSRDFRTSPGHNPCVPVTPEPPMPTIPRAATFLRNTVPGIATPPHVSIGISEQFLNHAGWGMFDSGLLCVGTGTALSQQLSTGLFSLLVRSLNNLVFPEAAAPLSIAIRPQQPLEFEIGEGGEADPVLTATLPQVQMDFYVWSTERYIRFMTYQADLSIPIDLVVEGGQVVPRIATINAANSMVTNTDLLQEDPATLAATMESVLSMFAGMALGGLGGFDLPSIMGINLDIPEGGIRGVEDGGDEFLGLFANLELASAPLIFPADTTLELGELELDRHALALETFGEGHSPRVRAIFGGEGPMGDDGEPLPLEFSYRIDGMFWSDWTSEREVFIEDEALLFQARHNIEARARIAGEPLSADPSPATAELLIDILPPHVEVQRVTGGVQVRGLDIISEQLEARWRVQDGEWTEWQELAADGITLPDRGWEIEIKDEAGNVESTSQAIIRGRPNPAAAAGCGCAVPNTRNDLPMSALLAFGLLGLVIRRRRRGDASPKARGPKARGLKGTRKGLTALAALFVVAGCNCGDDDTMVPPDTGTDSTMTMCGACGAGTTCCDATAMCVAYDEASLCGAGNMCEAGSITADGSCTVTCNCVPLPPLDEGMLATHLDMVAADGALFVSGYSDGAPTRMPYGDLVVGRYSAAMDAVRWEVVDGAPDSPVTGDPDGWRGGIAAPGADVGRFSSITVDGATIRVSYYDKDQGALKFATGSVSGGPDDPPSGSWASHVVDNEGDSGRYTSMVISGGRPVIAYLQLVPTASGRPTSRVRVATANNPNPASATDWTIETVKEEPIDCRPTLCMGTTCALDGSCGGAGEALPDPYIEDLPPAVGLFNALATTSGGLALVYYDRKAGNLMGASYGGSWGAPFLIDGYGREEANVGDSGIAADLFVDGSDVWHVSYVDGAEENLRYARVEGMTVTRETVDDGSTDGTNPNPDGRHIVGDDSSIVVSPSGEVRIAYQDSTVQRAMFARKSGGSWMINIVDDRNSAGYWVSQSLVGTTSYIAEFWREQDVTMRDSGTRMLILE